MLFRIFSRQNTLAQNVLLLFLVKIAGFLVPLASLPYLARVLGPESFGVISIAQSLAISVSVVIEYGFVLSGTRDVSRLRNSPDDISRISREILGAKLVLSVVALGIVYIVRYFVNGLDDLSVVIGAWVYALVIGFSPVWYFQGVENLRLYSFLDVFGKTAGLFLIVVFIQSPEDYWKVLFLQSAGSVGPLLISIVLMYRSVSFSFPMISDCIRGLNFGASMFVFRAAISFYTIVNAMLLGVFFSPKDVGSYSGAEKLVRGFAATIGPVSSAFFPRVSLLIVEHREKAEVFVKNLFWGLVLFTMIIAIFVSSFSEMIVTFVLGKDYAPAVELVRYMIWMVPLISIGNVLGIQWMLPMKLDRYFNLIVVVAGLANIGLVFMFVPRYGSLGMAFIGIFCEALVATSIAVVLIRRGVFPKLK